MKIKFILLISIFCIGFPVRAIAQSVNIWDITFDFLARNGYCSPDGYSRPTKTEENHIIYPYFIFGSNGSIDDPDFVIPNHDRLESYSFGSLYRQFPQHLLYVKNGRWRIIDMGKPLPNIITQCVDFCKGFELNDDKAIYVIDEVVKFYEKYEQELASMGVPIVSDASAIIQEDSLVQAVNIWNIIHDFLAKSGDTNVYKRPIKITAGITYPFFAFGINGYIDDIDFVIPKRDELDFYNFGKISERYQMYLLFVKNGKYRIVDMSKPFLDIIKDVNDLSKDFELNYKDSISAINTAISRYKSLKRIGIYEGWH